MLMFGCEDCFKYHLLPSKQNILVKWKFIDQGLKEQYNVKFKLNIENDA